MTIQQYNEIYNLAMYGMHTPLKLIYPRKNYASLIKRFYKYHNNEFLTGNMEQDIYNAKHFLFKQSHNNGVFKANTYRTYASAIIGIFDQMYGINFNHKHFDLPPADRSLVMPLLEGEQERLDLLMEQFIDNSKSAGILEHRNYLSNCYQAIKYTGMRISEFTSIDGENVKLEKYMPEFNLNIFAIKNEKIRKDRKSTKSTTRGAALNTQLGDFFKSSNIKYANQHSFTTTLRGFCTNFFKFAMENGFKGRLTPHVLRHTAVYNLFKGGVPLEHIALVIGDEPRTVGEHYVKNNPDILAQAISKIKIFPKRETNINSPIFERPN